MKSQRDWRGEYARNSTSATCPVCLGSFLAHPKLRTTYCSNRCRHRANAVGRSCPYPKPAPTLPVQQCTRCGASFPRRTPGLCSQACRIAHNRDQARAWYQERSVRDRSPRPCQECAEIFAPAYGDKHRLFCSDECRYEHHRRRYINSELGRRRKRGAPRIKRLRSVLLARYDGRCGPCGKPIDLTLHYYHPMSLTIDHIHPLSAGGTDDEANLWPAHRYCNEQKGDDIGWSATSRLWQAVA